ncbi:hypothetical protein ILYODFUR_002447 [Ilyodon furcidens]|uniref:Uncharacterized protein n=1 Tax=Ilyodon furcidens TaxID=33524 RepID=A0ABV0STL7_9TELE
MSLCNIIKLENRMYKLIPQSSRRRQLEAELKGGLHERMSRWLKPEVGMQPARRTESPAVDRTDGAPSSSLENHRCRKESWSSFQIWIHGSKFVFLIRRDAWSDS